MMMMMLWMWRKKRKKERFVDGLGIGVIESVGGNETESWCLLSLQRIRFEESNERLCSLQPWRKQRSTFHSPLQEEEGFHQGAT